MTATNKMFDIKKDVDIASGKVTYKQTIGSHTASCLASCEGEAKGKLGSDLLCALGLDGLIDAVADQLEQGHMKQLSNNHADHEAVVTDLQQQLVAERNKSWVQKLKDSFWRR